MKAIPLIVSKNASNAPLFLEKLASDYQEQFSIHVAHDAASVQRALREAALRSDFVIVGGGDGTLSAAARIFANTGKTLAVLPLGTTNNFARSIGYAKHSYEGLLRFYAKPFQAEIRNIDIGVVNGHNFLNVASIGISGRIAEEVDPRQKKIAGRLAYWFQAMKMLSSAKKFKVELTSRSEHPTASAYQILIFNGSHHAGIQVKTRSYLESGRLYLVLLGGRTPLHYLVNFLRFMAGRPSSDTPRFSLTEFSLALDREELLELDGEPEQFRSGKFAVEHASLQVVKIPEALP